MAYIGVEPGSRSIRTVTKHTATSSQTVFNVTGGYVKGFVDVYKQGLKLVEGTDFNATDNLTVVLTSGASLNDKVDIIAYSPLALYSVVSKAGDAMTGDLTVPNLSATANVIGANGYFTNLKVDSNAAVNSSLSITGNTTQTGNYNLTGNINLTGSLIITGAATSVSTQSLSVTDSIIVMAANNNVDTLDIGFAGRYNNGSANVYTGIVRDSTQKVYYVFNEYDSVPGNNIDLSNPSFKIANLHANFNGNLVSNSVTVTSLNATNGTFTSSITLTGDASGYRQESTSIYGGDAGAGFGRIEYHDNRWILNSGSDSSNVVVFQRGNLVKSYVDNNGAFTGPVVLSGTFTANGGVGTSGQVLTSNGTGAYWSTVSGGSGTPSGSNTSIQFNDSGSFGGVANLTFDKSTNIISVGNSTVNTQIAANGVTLTGDSGLVPFSNTVGTTFGVSDKRWVITANTGNFTGTVTGTVANMSTSVNSASLTVGTNFIANTTGVYHTGTINAISLTTTGVVVNTTAIVPTSNTILLGNSTGRFVLSANTGDFTGTVTGTVANMSTSVNSSLLTVGTSFIANTTGAYHTGTVNASSFTTSGFVANTTVIAPTSNTILLGNSIGRFILSANTGDFSGTVTGTVANMSTSVNSALLTVGTSFIANTVGAYHTGTINATSFTTTGLLANTTALVPTSNTILLGNSIGRFVLSANTIDTSGAATIATTLSAGNTTITGFANISTSVNSALLTVGTSFIANTTALVVTTPLTANGSVGSGGQGLLSNGATGSPYWSTVLTSIPATYVQNTDSRTLSGNLVISGTYFNPSANTILLGNSTQRWILSANTGDFSGDVTGTSANMSTSVNSALLTVGTSFVANTTGAYHTGTVNAASFTTTGLVANVTALVPTSNTILLGNSIGRFVLTANTGDFSGAVTGTSANMSTSVNSALLTVGTSFIANTTALVVTTPLTANGTTGSSGEVLLSNGATGSPYWGTVSSSVPATYVQNTDSRTLSGNLVISGTYFNPSANTILLGNSIQRWVLSANTGDFSGAVTGTSANMSTSVNSALLTVGTNFIANTTALVVTTPLTANGTTGTSGQVLHSNGTTGAPYWTSVTASVPATYVQNTDSRTLSGNLVISGTYFNPSANTILLGNSIQRWVLSANTGDFSGAVTGISANMSTSVNSALLTVGTNFIANTTGAYHTGTINAASLTVGTSFIANTTGTYHTGTVNAASLTVGTSFIANTTGAYHTGTINAASHTTSGVTANATGVYPSSNSSGTALGDSTRRWIVNANTGNFSGQVDASSFNTTSDSNKKDNIETLVGSLDKIINMRGVSFTWKDNNKKSIGVIAQEIESIVPEIVHTNNDGFKSVSYDSIIGLLIEAIKEQQVTIDFLKSKLETKEK